MFTLAILLLVLFTSVLATPLTPSPRSPKDIWVPRVTYPNTGTIWKVKTTHNVTWETADAPVDITNEIGRIMLYMGDQVLPVILADKFDVRTGRVEVQVPWVVPANDYGIVFFGDSGDWSPHFSIVD